MSYGVVKRICELIIIVSFVCCLYRSMAIVIVLDLTLPNELWYTMETLLSQVNRSLVSYCSFHISVNLTRHAVQKCIIIVLRALRNHMSQ